MCVLCVCVCACVCVCVCVCVCASFTSFHIPLYGGRAQDLCSECKTDQFDLTDWMGFQPFILCGRSALIKKPLKIPKAIHQHGKAENGVAEKTKITLI